MPAEQLLVLSANPRSGRRRLPGRDSKGRFLKRGAAGRAGNPRRAVAVASKKKRKGRSRSTTVAVRAHRRQRNPRTAFLDTLTLGALPAAIGAGGALAADFGLSFLPLPEAMKAGWVKHLTRAGAAVLLGGVSSYLVKPAMALQIGTGALTVAFHGAFRDVLTRMLPPEINARLGDYDDLDLAALGIYSSGPVEDQALSAYERSLGQADDYDGMAAFEQSINGLGDTIDL